MTINAFNPNYQVRRNSTTARTNKNLSFGLLGRLKNMMQSKTETMSESDKFLGRMNEEQLKDFANIAYCGQNISNPKKTFDANCISILKDPTFSLDEKTALSEKASNIREQYIGKSEDEILKAKIAFLEKYNVKTGKLDALLGRMKPEEIILFANYVFGLKMERNFSNVGDVHNLHRKLSRNITSLSMKETMGLLDEGGKLKVHYHNKSEEEIKRDKENFLKKWIKPGNGISFDFDSERVFAESNLSLLNPVELRTFADAAFGKEKVNDNLLKGSLNLTNLARESLLNEAKRINEEIKGLSEEEIENRKAEFIKKCTIDSKKNKSYMA